MSTRESEKPLRVAIVGGGIAGLTLAVGLVQQIEKHGANIELQVFEQAAKFAEIGAGVALGPNALKCLELLGLGEVMRKLGGCPKETENIWFEYRFAEDSHSQCGDLITTIEGPRAGQGSVHRANFLDSLIDFIPKKYCSFDHRLVEFKQNGEAASLTFANGKTVEVDMVIACDGVKSPLRKALYRNLGIDKTAPVEKYAEWIAWRGLIPAETYKQAMGRPASVPIMWCGMDRHILTFPVKNGAMVNLVGFVRDAEYKKINGQTAPWAEDRPSEELLADFAAFNDGCRAMLKAIEKPSIWGIFHLPPLDVISGDGIILAGDAAHATTPHQGAGAGQAIEDALFLSRLLARPELARSRQGSSDLRVERLRKAAGVYRKYRQERAAKIQTTSFEAGLLYEGRGVNGEGQDANKLKANLNERMRWIWNHDIEGQLESMIRDLDAALQ